MNPANAITLFRILLLPILLAFLLTPGDLGGIWALILFGGLALSDYFDGVVARSLHLESKFGATFDHIADKLLVATALLGLLATKAISPWPVALILAREFLVLGLRILDAGEVGKILAAEGLGKAKTVSQLVAIGWLILGWPYGEGLLWIAVALTWVSAGDYWLRFQRAHPAEAAGSNE